MKTDNLEFRWDEDEQQYSEQQEYSLSDTNSKRNLEEYFEFLSDIEPAFVLPLKDQGVGKQFLLYK